MSPSLKMCGLFGVFRFGAFELLVQGIVLARYMNGTGPSRPLGATSLRFGYRCRIPGRRLISQTFTSTPFLKPKIPTPSLLKKPGAKGYSGNIAGWYRL